MKNLHKCSVKVSISNEQAPYVIVKSLPNGSYALSGGEISLLTALSNSLNFTLDFASIGPEGYFYANGTAAGPMKALLDGVVDISVSNWWLKEHRSKFFDYTNPFTTDPVILLVPPGRDFNAFEKIVLPFSFSLWLLIFLCFLVGFSIILTIKLRFTTAQSFFFGEGVKNPYLNMFNGLLGGTQKIVPKRNFARFILMMFLIYALVIRSLYQGSFYMLIKSNMRHDVVQTINEMIEKDFKFYTYVGNFDVFSGTEYIKSRLSLFQRLLY